MNLIKSSMESVWEKKKKDRLAKVSRDLGNRVFGEGPLFTKHTTFEQSTQLVACIVNEANTCEAVTK